MLKNVKMGTEGNELKDRLFYYLDFKNISTNKFEKTIGAGGSYLNNVKSVGSDKLAAIGRHYPDLNIDWLVTGKGEMFKPADTPSIVNEATVKYGKGSNVISGSAMSQGDVTQVSGGTNVSNHFHLPPKGYVKIIRPDGTIEMLPEGSVSGASQNDPVLMAENIGLKNEIKTLKELLTAKDEMLEMYKSNKRTK